MKRLLVPTSKSYANRLLILGAIDPGPVELIDLPSSSDVEAMLRCLVEVGLNISRSGSKTVIHNSFPDCEKKGPPLALYSGDGGSTNRFLLAFLARGRRTYILKPSRQMLARPVQGLVDALNLLGVSADHLQVRGPFPQNGSVEVDCRESTQFVSAILLATADLKIKVKAVNIRSSVKYLALTEALVADFKRKNLNTVVPPDWSAISYPLALALFTGEVLIENCHRIDPLQADALFLSLIESMGGRPRFLKEGLFLDFVSEPLRSVKVDASKCPDLIPTLSFVCSYLQGTSVIDNMKVLRNKECDRVEEILRLLRIFSVKYNFDEERDSLTITGPAPGANRLEYFAPADHRMVMTAYLFMRKNCGGRLHGAEFVSKSFPDFFNF